jgi:drug/metabolite transporter (DMT)-like permease
MNKDFDQLAARAAPAIFVVLWSTGFVATKYVLRSAEPLTYLAILRWFGERVTPLQWMGLLLGLAGVALILHERPMSGEAGWGWLSSGVSLVSITLGTLYQRRYCRDIDWRAGNLVQYIGVTIFFAASAAIFETRVVHWTSEFVLSVAWLAVVLSIGSIGLLYWLIRRSAATSVASLFYLVPAVTALMAYVLFGERLDAVAIAGMIACAAAVFVVNR